MKRLCSEGFIFLFYETFRMFISSTMVYMKQYTDTTVVIHSAAQLITSSEFPIPPKISSESSTKSGSTFCWQKVANCQHKPLFAFRELHFVFQPCYAFPLFSGLLPLLPLICTLLSFCNISPPTWFQRRLFLQKDFRRNCLFNAVRHNLSLSQSNTSLSCPGCSPLYCTAAF